MITSLANKTIKDAAALKKSGERRKSGLILIDGFREIEIAMQAQVKIHSLFYCLELIAGRPGVFDKVSAEKRIEVSQAVFKKICYKENPDGFLAMAEPRERQLKDLKLSVNPLIIILENVEKPGNLGGIIRTAYAAGVEAIIINSAQTDIYNPNVIRASEGYVFKKDIISASVPDTIKWLKKNKIKSFGAATTGAKVYTAVDLTGGVAIVLGSEASGLSAEWLKGAGKLIKIPMKDGIDSLNVSAAAAVIIYEAVRQRMKI